MTWLVTGGAGYIGAHVVHDLVSAGRQVAVLDDLSTGRPGRLPGGVPVVVGSVLDERLVTTALRTYDVTGIVHLAARKQVPESVARPLLYWRENVGGVETLLRCAIEAGVRRVVFSSSAAVYGVPAGDGLVGEDAPTAPINPYGRSKLAGEQLLADIAATGQLDYVALRYFNVAGAAADALVETVATNLIPLAFEALADGRRPQVFGSDYPTPDGTCVRDYIHVADLSGAHLAAIAGLESGERRGDVYNVGRGEGASVREVLATVAAVTGLPVEPEILGRRPGDPASVVADARNVRTALGWSPSRNLTDMVASAWRGWRSTGPVIEADGPDDVRQRDGRRPRPGPPPVPRSPMVNPPRP